MDEIVGVRFLAGNIDILFRDLGHVQTITDVFFDRSREQVWLLRYNTNLVLVPFGVILVDVSSTEKYLP